MRRNRVAYHEGVKRVAIAVLGILLGVPLVAQTATAPISVQVLNQYGSPVANANVYVCAAGSSTRTPCSPLATIYSDYNLTTPIANPTQTDSMGDANFYVGTTSFPNIYVVQASPDGTNYYTWLFNGPACSLSGCTVSGTVTAQTFNATVSPYYEVNGSQLASTNLADSSNLARINAANTFTGSPQTAPIFNATTQFNVNGSQIAAANLANGVTGSGLIVLYTSPTLITPNIGVASGTSLALSGNETVGGTMGVTGKATAPVFNGTTGFQANGAAPLNHVLVGNGTYYVDSATIPSAALPNFNYQTVALNGTGQTQRPTLNFNTYFTATDSSSPAETTIGLLTAGTDGRVLTAGSAGTLNYFACGDNNGGVQWSSTACASGSGTQNDQYFVWSPTCGLSASTDSACTGTITIPTPEADTNFFVNMTVNTGGAYIYASQNGAQGTSTIPYLATCTYGCNNPLNYTITVHVHHP